MKEHGIQNTIRNRLAEACFCFRANVGKGWQGVGKPYRVDRPMTLPLSPGDVVLRQARPFDTGLPPGFHDLFGWVEVEITPDMVGQKIAQFFSLEVKAENGRVSPQQEAFRHAVQRSGGLSRVVRSADDAAELIASAKQGSPRLH